MTSVIITMFLKPFVALVVLGLICLPARLAVSKLPDSWLKRLLLFRVLKSPGSTASGRPVPDGRVVSEQRSQP